MSYWYQKLFIYFGKYCFMATEVPSVLSLLVNSKIYFLLPFGRRMFHLVTDMDPCLCFHHFPQSTVFCWCLFSSPCPSGSQGSGVWRGVWGTSDWPGSGRPPSPGSLKSSCPCAPRQPPLPLPSPDNSCLPVWSAV